ncbi:MAG: transposase [Bacteroidales bacterium]|nr:transposase [Candidatus Latescibacterota bacterium]
MPDLERLIHLYCCSNFRDRLSSPVSLANEIGVSRSSLYRWVSEADTLEMAVNSEPPSFTESMQRLSNMKRPQDWSAEEKLTAVLEAATLSEEELGAFLRSRGLHEAQLQQWRDQMLVGLEPKTVKRAETKRILALEKELRRKEKALAETAALLVLKKKAQDIWGDEDEDTDS